MCVQKGVEATELEQSESRRRSGQRGQGRPLCWACKSSLLPAPQSSPHSTRVEIFKTQIHPVTPLLKFLQGLLQAHGPKPQLLTVPHQGPVCPLPAPSPPFSLLLPHWPLITCTSHLPLPGIVFAYIPHLSSPPPIS